MFSTKTILFCLVISLFSVASTCNGEGYAPAPICARNECPKYSVVYSQKEFEIISYNRSTTVYGPTIPSNSYKPAASKGFNILLDYFKGKNRQGMVLNMTSSVLVLVENSTYKVYFFLTYMNRVYFPTPLVEEIEMTHIPYKGHKYVVVRRFDGLINDESIAMHAAALKKSVASTPYKSAAKSYAYIVASYNPP